MMAYRIFIAIVCIAFLMSSGYSAADEMTPKQTKELTSEQIEKILEKAKRTTEVFGETLVKQFTELKEKDALFEKSIKEIMDRLTIIEKKLQELEEYQREGSEE